MGWPHTAICLAPVRYCVYVMKMGVRCSDPFSNTAQSAMGRPNGQWDATAGWAGPLLTGPYC